MEWSTLGKALKLSLKDIGFILILGIILALLIVIGVGFCYFLNWLEKTHGTSWSVGVFAGCIGLFGLWCLIQDKYAQVKWEEDKAKTSEQDIEDWP